MCFTAAAATCAAEDFRGLGLSRNAINPKILDYQLSTSNADKSSLSKIRYSDEDQGACIGTGKYFEIDFKRTVPVYKIVFQGQLSETNVTKKSSP